MEKIKKVCANCKFSFNNSLNGLNCFDTSRKRFDTCGNNFLNWKPVKTNPPEFEGIKTDNEAPTKSKISKVCQNLKSLLHYINSKLRKNDVVDIMGYLTLLCVANDWTDFEEFKD